MGLTLREEQMLAAQVKKFPCLYDTYANGFKEKDLEARKEVVENVWETVASSLEFVDNGRYLIFFYYS